MARGQSRSGTRTAQRRRDNDGILPVLAKAVREVENAVQRGSVTGGQRTKFQVAALLAREERARVRADGDISEGQRDAQLKRLDGIGTILAQTAAREPSLFHLLAEDADVSEAARELKRRMQVQAGMEPEPEPEPSEPDIFSEKAERQVVPQSVIQRQLANPFLTPDFSAAAPAMPKERRLVGWELIGPLLNSFEYAAPGAPSHMELPENCGIHAPDGLELMHHQERVVAAAASGHRTFLLADEPGLGKTAQALLAAQAADAFPLLVVVPNVVKTNWAREAALWTPRRPVTVIHGDGGDIDGFADIVVVNYEVLDRHVGWMDDHGFRGMVVDEAHFIKNKKSQRSQHVLELSRRIRTRVPRPLLMALTGTPLINDIEDFRAIWEFLGWIDDKKPLNGLMAKLEETGLTPADHGFYPRARQAVVDMGIVRRRKIDVAADIPARRVADLPVELDEALARSIREAERELAERLMARYDQALETRREGSVVDGIDVGAGTPGRRLGAPRRRRVEVGGERLRDGAPDRPGQGRAGRRLRRPARAQRRQGRVLRQAHRRDGRRRGGLRRPAASSTPRSAATRPAPHATRRSTRSPTTPRSRSSSARSPRPASASTSRSRPTSSWPSCPGPTPSRPRPSTGCTGSARPSPSPPGGSSPRRPSTPRSPS